MAFCSQLHALARPIWQKQHEHPFPLGIAAGTLAPERFENWLRQDYLYLADYARAYAMAAARSDSLSLMRFFARTASRTLDHEMALHRRFAAKFGIDDDALEREAAWPTTRAYGDFLVRVAATESPLTILAAVLPCEWGYVELASVLSRKARDAKAESRDARYSEWLELYSSAEYQEVVDWLKDELDRRAKKAGDSELATAQRLFMAASRYELAFWQMCWDGQ
jgi:thiaminase/transcriptional activator TenA